MLPPGRVEGPSTFTLPLAAKHTARSGNTGPAKGREGQRRASAVVADPREAAAVPAGVAWAGAGCWMGKGSFCPFTQGISAHISCLIDELIQVEMSSFINYKVMIFRLTLLSSNLSQLSGRAQKVTDQFC